MRARDWGGPLRPWVLLALLSGACGREPPVEPPPSPVPVALVLSAPDTLRVTGAMLACSAVAVDSAGAPVPGVSIAWSVEDSTRGRISVDGVFTAGPDSGRTWVRARVITPPLAESLPVRVVTAGTVKWTWPAAELGGVLPGIVGPALGADGTIYVLVETDRTQHLARLVALDAAGRVRWSTALEGVVGDFPVVTPGGEILVVGWRLYLVEPDGTVRWNVLLDAGGASFNGGAVTNDLVFAVYGFHMAALELATGDTLWQSQLAPLASWLVPPTTVGTDVVYAKRTSDTLFAFRQRDGVILRTFLDPDSGVVFGRGAVPVGARVYLPSFEKLAAFDTAGSPLWVTDWTGNGISEPTVGPDGALYVQNRRWGLQAINVDGTTRWYGRHVLPDGNTWSESPRWPDYGGDALAERGIIYAAGQGAFYAYDVAGALRWSFVADSAGWWQSFLGAPAIAPDGTVYTFTGTDVYAFWGPAPPEPNSPWPMWRHDAQRTGWVR
jgi:hypothetical protein